MQNYRRDGKFIYYQDETWLNEGMTNIMYELHKKQT